MMKDEKLEKDGDVAVLVSYGYGAGWYSWNRDLKSMLFDKDIAKILIDCDNEPSAEDKSKIIDIAKDKYPSAYIGGADGLTVKWVGKGKAFEINEYDGYESLNIIGMKDYLIA